MLDTMEQIKEVYRFVLTITGRSALWSGWEENRTGSTLKVIHGLCLVWATSLMSVRRRRRTVRAGMERVGFLEGPRGVVGQNERVSWVWSQPGPGHGDESEALNT